MAGRSNKSAKLDAIYDVFEKHGVKLDRDSIWDVQGTPVVKHKDVERLGAKLNIKYDIPTLIRSERDEAVIMVVGRLGDRMEWSIGEALINKEGQPGGNYKVTGKQAGYVYAMAEKRAKDRVILKLADLHGDVYSEEEADDFKEEGRNNSRSNDSRSANDNRQSGKQSEKSTDDEIVEKIRDFKIEVDECNSRQDLIDLMTSKDTGKFFSTLTPDEHQDIRKYAEDRLAEVDQPKAANG
jgi:hypothetical protein